MRQRKKESRFFVAAFAALTASALTISLCAALITPAYGWFRSNAAGGINSIQSASYTLESWSAISPETGESRGQPKEIDIAPGDEHHFLLTTGGNASKGYCTIGLGENKYYVPIPGGESIYLVIKAAAGTTIEKPVAQWGTPPTDGPGTIVNTAASFDMSEDAPLMAYIEDSETPSILYTVPEGAPLEVIAGHYGVSPEDILSYNGIDSIGPGDEILIPNPSTETPYEPPAQYIVEEGDCLGTIAEAFNVTVKSLCQWNGLSADDPIYPGMRLTIPVLYESPEPVETQPVETEPVETEPVETEPVETEPVETEPVETEPVETEPVETEPVQTQPVETEPVETEPVETQPVETEPVETQPVETEPVETQPVETEPVETQSVETESVETQPVETEPAETQPVETQPVETQPVETEPVETQPVETQPVETDPVAAEPADDTVYVCGVPLYFQGDYPDTLYGDGTVKTSGCSVTSLTMVANAVTGYDYEVDELAEYFGGRALNHIDRLERGSKTLGLSFRKTENWHETWQALNDGKIAIVLMDGIRGGCLFTESQHFIVLTGLNEQGKIMVNDSNRGNYEKWNLKNGFENGFDPEDILYGYSGAWVYDRQLEELPERYREKRIIKAEENKNYPEITLTAAERELLARVIWVEARGECEEGQQAVAEVVFNRMLSDQFGDTLDSVIYGEGQFRSVPYLEDAEPGQAQYQAIDRAMYGDLVLNKNVFYFATTPTNDKIYKQIGNHIFCY